MKQNNCYLWLFAIALLTIFAGCQKDLLQEEDSLQDNFQAKDGSFEPYERNYVTFEEFSAHLQGYEVFEYYVEKFEGIDSESYISAISKNRILKLENDSITAYTLNVTTPDVEGDSFTNIVFIEQDDELIRYLMQYTPTIEWKNAVIEGGRYPGYEGAVSFIDDSGEAFSSLENYPTNPISTMSRACHSVFYTENIPCCGSISCCPCTDGNGVDILVIEIVCSGGGGGGDGGDDYDNPWSGLFPGTGGGNGGGAGPGFNQQFPTEPMEPEDFMMLGYYIEGLGGEVDWSYQVILDPEFVNNECLYDVYEDLGKAPTFNNYLQNFDGDMSVANLRFSVGVHPKYPTANAVTFAPVNYLIKVMFNPNMLNRPSLDVARTFIHEMIHAEIYRKLLSLADQGAIPWSKQFIESMRNDYPGLHDYYMRYYFNMPYGIPSGDPQHEVMAQHYRGIIIDVLMEYDNSYSNNIYEALSWVGLMGSGPVNQSTGLPPNPTVAWENLSQQERLSIINVYNDFKANNPNCQ